MSGVVRIGSARVARAVIRVPAAGVWYADVELEEAPDLSGHQVLTVGAVDLVGTIDPRYTGTFAFQRSFRLVGGAGGWGKILPPKGYHADAGVRARDVAADAAREAGETLGSTFAPGATVLGRDFARARGPASVALDRAAGGASWWVDYAGATHVGPRPASTPASGSYIVQAFDPRARRVQFGADALDAVPIGAALSGGQLDAPVVVRDLEITAAEELTFAAWCSPLDTAQGRLIDALRAIVRRETMGRLFGVYEFRVGQLRADGRYELQAVTAGDGVPDVIPCAAWPGVAGSHSKVALGAHVLVQFIAGDSTRPVLTQFIGRDGERWKPTEAILAASVAVRFGDDTADRALALAQKTDDAFGTFRTKFNGHGHTVDGGVAAPVVVPQQIPETESVASETVFTNG